MCTFKVSKKPNVWNLLFKFCPPPQKLLGGGGQKFVSPLDFVQYTPLNALQYCFNVVFLSYSILVITVSKAALSNICFQSYRKMKTRGASYTRSDYEFKVFSFFVIKKNILRLKRLWSRKKVCESINEANINYNFYPVFPIFSCLS